MKRVPDGSPKRFAYGPTQVEALDIYIYIYIYIRPRNPTRRSLYSYTKPVCSHRCALLNIGLELQRFVDHTHAKTNIDEVRSIRQIDLERYMLPGTKRTVGGDIQRTRPLSPATLKPISPSAALNNKFWRSSWPRP